MDFSIASTSSSHTVPGMSPQSFHIEPIALPFWSIARVSAP